MSFRTRSISTSSTGSETDSNGAWNQSPFADRSRRQSDDAIYSTSAPGSSWKTLFQRRLWNEPPSYASADMAAKYSRQFSEPNGGSEHSAAARRASFGGSVVSHKRAMDHYKRNVIDIAMQ